MFFLLDYMFGYMKICSAIAAIFIVYRLLVREKKGKIKGHYTKPGKLKVHFYYLILSVQVDLKERIANFC